MCDFDTPVTLIAVTVTGRDDIGNPVRKEATTEVWAELKSVTRAEFQAAGAMGLKPSLLVVVPDVDYHGETLVELGTERYSVYRDYRKGETRELYVTQKGGEVRDEQVKNHGR